MIGELYTRGMQHICGERSLSTYLNLSSLHENTHTVEPPNKGHLGTRASVLYSEVSFIWRLEMY